MAGGTGLPDEVVADEPELTDPDSEVGDLTETDETPPINVRRIGEDPAEFEAFYREYVRPVQRFIARRANDPQVVADLTSDTFLAAIGAAKRFDPQRGAALSWLYGIAYRVVASHSRRAARGWRAHAREGGRRVLAEDALSALEDRLAAESEARAAREAFAELPKGDRAVLELRLVDGLSITEVAEALNISEGATRVRLHRARQRLEKGLGDRGVTR